MYNVSLTSSFSKVVRRQREILRLLVFLLLLLRAEVATNADRIRILPRRVRDGFSTGFQRYFGFGLSALTLYAFNLAIDDLLLYEKAKSVAMPKLEKSQRVLNVVALNRNDDDGVRLETDFWYNASCNKRGENAASGRIHSGRREGELRRESGDDAEIRTQRNNEQ